MQNFNIRYECLDQRDDFLSELKKGAAVVPSWMNNDSITHEMNQSEVLNEQDNVTYNGIQTDEIDVNNLQSHRYRH